MVWILLYLISLSTFIHTHTYLTRMDRPVKNMYSIWISWTFNIYRFISDQKNKKEGDDFDPLYRITTFKLYLNQNTKSDIVCKFGTQSLFWMSILFFQLFFLSTKENQNIFYFPGGRFIVRSNFKTKYHSLRWLPEIAKNLFRHITKILTDLTRQERGAQA